MHLTSWLSVLKTIGFCNQPARRLKKRNMDHTASMVEMLEDRALLSTFRVSLTGDDATGDGSVATPYRTIQAAVDAAAATSDGDDIVQVAAGTYNSLDVDGKISILANANLSNLLISGGWDASFSSRTPQSTIYMPDYAGAPTLGSQGDIDVVSPGTTIDGFTFVFDGNGLGVAGGTRISGGIVVQGTGITINNNTIEVGGNPGSGARSTGIQTASSDTSNLVVSNNTIHADGQNLAQAIFLNPGMGANTQIISNTITGSSFAGIITIKERGDVTIADNLIQRTGASPYQEIDVRTSSSVIPITNLSITGNTIDGNGSGLGIHLGDGTGTQAITGFVVSKNEILNHSTSAGIVVGPGANQASIISGTIAYNSFSGNANGLFLSSFNGGSDAIDASRNWWDDDSGPSLIANPGGTGQSITDLAGVTFAPWLIYSPDTNPALPGVQLPNTVTVISDGDISAADNDFTRLQNAIGAAATGQTIDIKGTFDWTTANSSAAYLASTNTATVGDLRGVAIPDEVNNLTITSSDSTAHIIGQGDLGGGIYETFAFTSEAASPVNTNLTIEKLNIDHFESAITMGWNNSGSFNGTKIQGNVVTLDGDNEGSQNIAFYLYAGQNQHVTGNTVTFEGDGTNGGGAAARSYGFQNATIGGTSYDGLLIDNNIFQLGATSGGGEIVTGIRENGHNDDNNSDLAITNNQFLGRTGADFDRGLMLTSQSTGLVVDGNIFTDVNDVFFARDASGGTDPGDQFTITNSVLTRVGGADGIFLQNVTTDPTPTHVLLNWGINNAVDGFTGVRGLNELSVAATGDSRPLTGASDLDSVNAIGVKAAVFVDDNAAGAARFTDPDGIGSGVGPLAAGFNAFSTIAAGIAAVDVGGTVNVAAGAYKENPTIGKSLTIAGPNAGLSGGGTRSGEAHVTTNGAANAVFTVSANNVTIQGLEIDGNDPLVSGGTLTSGADSNALYGVRPTAAFNGIAVRDNIIENVFIGFRGDGASQGNVIDSNWFHDVGAFDFGYAVSLRTNYYADVTSNLMTKVLTGLHTNAFSSAGGPATWTVSGNEIHSFAGGIWHNLQYDSATSITIDNNQIFAEAGALANNYGIQLVSLQGTVGATITRTTITGTDYGLIAWNASTANTPTLGSSNSIVNAKTGVYVTNNLSFNPVGLTTFGLSDATENVSLDGISITGSTLEAVRVQGQSGAPAVNVTIQSDTQLVGSASPTDTGVLITGPAASATIQNNDASIHGFNIGIDVNGGVGTVTNNHLYDNATAVRFTNGGQGSVTANNFNDAIDNGTDLRLDADAGAVAIGAGNLFAGDTYYIDNRSSQTFDLTTYTAANWEGLTNNFRTEDKLFHAPDSASSGLIRTVANNVYVTSPGTGANNETIQRAINAAGSGDTVNVESGVYAENLIVDKSLNLIGPNASIDPNTGARNGEAVLLPAVVETSVQGSSSGVIVRVGTVSGHVDVTVNGFTIDGHNDSLTGGRTLNGVEIHTGAGIANSIGSFDSNPGGYDATLNVQNNIIQNLERYGVLVDNTASRSAKAGNDISYNKIDNLPSGNNFGGDRGRATAFEENIYGTVSYNVITRVNVGWQDDNYDQASPGAGTLIDHNTISTYHRGIFHNLQYSNATAATISNNTISAETNGQFPASSTNFGIELASIFGTVGETVSNNNISGNVYGIVVWGVGSTGAVTVSGGTLTGNQYGIYVTSTDPQFGTASGDTQATIAGVNVVNSTIAGITIDNSANIGTVSLAFGSGNSVTGGPVGLVVNGPNTEITGDTLNNTAFAGQSGNYITLADSALDNQTINAAGVTFDGSLPSAMSLAQQFALENKIFHEVDDPTLGLIETIPGVFLVTPATVPTATDNDYTRLANIMGLISSGDTVTLSGTFDWSEPNAAASWALGNDGLSGTGDDYSLLAPVGINDVTWTSASLGSARIQGPGDLAAVNLEGVFYFDGGDNQNWTLSNLEIFDFDLAIGFFFGSGGTDAYSNTTITNNHIRVPVDLNASVAPIDVNQNIGIHFSFGANETISDNIIDIDGAGVSDGANFSTSVGMQSNTSGGSVYDGLVISGNTINVTGSLNAQPSTILGIWENGDAQSSDITVSGNHFNNQTGANAATNLMRAFRVTSHSSATTTVVYSDNTVDGANIGFQWLPGADFAGDQPVQLTGNVVTNTQTGVLIQSNGLATLSNNILDGIGGTSIGVDIVAGATASLFRNEISGTNLGVNASGTLVSASENFVRNNAGDGIRINSTGIVTGAISDNDLSGNTGLSISNLSASLINAPGNFYGVSTPAGVGAEVSSNVDYSPWLNLGTDTDLVTAGFQGDFSSLGVDDDSPQTGAGGRIQEAVTLLQDGLLVGGARTIDLAPGTYSEAADLNIPLTLVLGGNTTIDSVNSIAAATIDLQSYTLTLGDATAVDTLAGAIRGPNGGLIKTGPGTLALNGTNTYTGPTAVNAGVLLVNGSTTSATTVASGATLGGSGTINDSVTVNSGGTLTPGSSTGSASPGILGTGPLLLAAGSEFQVDVNGRTAGTQADEVITTGPVGLNNAILTPTGNVTAFPGQVITLINNVGAGAVTGTFAGLAEGSTVTINGLDFQLSYRGGTGNDVTLTEAPAVVMISDAIANESAGMMTFTLTLDQTLDIDITVDVNFVDETAIGGVDFDNTTQHILIPAGQTSGQFSVPITNDTIVEGTETFSVVLSTATDLGGREVDLSDRGAGAISDNDSATVSIASTSNGAETSTPTNGQFTVSLTAPSSTDTVVTYSVAGSATPGAGNDYAGLTGSVTILAGQTSAMIDISVFDDAIVEGTETVVVTLTGFGAHDQDITLNPGAQTASVDITDDDTTTLTISSPTIVEGDSGISTLTFTVTSPNAVQGGFTVAFSVADVSTDGADYAVVTTSPLTFSGAAGETQTITVNVIGDTIVEGDESLTVTLGTVTPVAPVSAASIITGQVGTGTITNDDESRLTISSPTITEGDTGTTTFTFTVTSPNAVAGGFTVDFNLADISTDSSDYTLVTSSPLTFAGTAGEMQTISVTVNGDGLVDGDETFTVTLGAVTAVTPVQAGSIVTGAVGTATIVNDDTSVLSISSATVTEGDAGTTNLTFTVTSTADVAGRFAVDFNVTGVTADGSDYSVITSSPLTFSGVAGETQTITISVIGDTIVEGDETFTVTLGAVTPVAPVQASSFITGASATGTITNDDSTTLLISSPTVSEGDNGTTALIFTVTSPNAVQSGFTVDFSLADITTDGNDYTLVTTSPLAFAGITGETQTITINVIGDQVVEADETLSVTLGAVTPVLPVSAGSVTSGAVGTGTIINDDGDTLTISSPTVAEGDSGTTLLTFTVTSPTAVSGGFAVNFNVNDLSTNGADYTVLTSGPLIFTGAAGETRSITISVVGDTIVEGDETFSVILGNVVTSPPVEASSVVTGAVGIGTITNDDSSTLTISNATVLEGDAGTTSLTFTVTSSTAVQGGFTVAFNVNDVTTNGGDYTVVTSSPLTFAGNAGETQTITINAIGDTIVEGDEVLTVVLGTVILVSPVQPASIATGAAGTGTITNDDTTTLTIDSPTVTEGDLGTTTLTYTVTSTQAVEGGFTVAFSGTNISASGSDYTVVTSSPLVFTGTAGEIQTITVNVIGDTIVEGDETFTVTLGTVTPFAPVLAGSIATGASGTATILDDDTATVSIVQLADGVEGNTSTNGTFRVSQSAVSATDTIVTYTVTGTATAGSDYIALTGTVTIPAGQTFVDIDVPVLNDSIVEGLETVVVTLTGFVTNDPAITLDTAANSTATVTIVDSDTATFTISNATVNEADGTLVFDIVTDTPLDRDFTINVTFTDVTATGGTDYANATQTITFLAGQTSKQVSVAINDDNVVEATESFTAALSAVTASDGYSVDLSDTGTGAVLDNDSATFTINDVTVSESSGAFVFTLSTDKALDIDVTITVSFTDGSATGGGVDYESATQQITFLAGETSKQVVVVLNDDSLLEGDETFTATLSSMTPLAGRTIDITDIATGTIVDDDTAIVSIAKITDGVESNSPTDGKFRVSLSAVSTTDTVVNYTVSGTATAGTDFTPLTETVTIPAGQVSADINVGVLNDAIVESAETVVVTLTGFGNPNPDIVLDSNQANLTATVLITDDDVNTLTISSPTISEGNAGSTNLTFTVTSPTAVAGGFTVAFNVADITTNGSDYTIVTASPLTFSGAAGETQTITINVIGDLVVESDETFSVTLGQINQTSQAVATRVITGASGTGTIVNDDTDTLLISSPTVVEGNAGTTALTFTVTSPSAVQGGFTVAFSVANITTNGTDYTVITSSPLSFAGVAGETQTITINVIGDTILEANETLSVTLGAITPVVPVDAADITSGAIGTGTIQNDDTSFVTISKINDGSESNSPSHGKFRVTLSAVSPSDTVVTYSVSGTATSGVGQDYATLSGTVTIPAGQLSADIDVSVLNDSLVEDTETVIVTLTGFTAHDPQVTLDGNATQLTATVNISDDDPLTITSSANATIPENTPAPTVVLDVNADPVAGHSVTYSLSGPDAARFIINPANGEIRFASSPNFEAPADQGADNEYHVTVTATADFSPSRSTSQDVTITVTPVNDNDPVFVNTSPTFLLPENSTNGTVVGSVSATDSDLPSETLTYSILSGNEAGAFAINPSTGQISVADSTQLDFESLTSYTLQVRVTDNGGLIARSADAMVVINLTDVLEGPLITIPNVQGSYQIGSPATIVAPDATFTDIDVANPDFSNATLTVSITAGHDKRDRLRIAKTGDDVNQVHTRGRKVFVGDLQVGTVKGGHGKRNPNLVVTLNSSATNSAVQSLIQRITFQAKAGSGVTRTISMQLTNVSGTDSNVATRDIVVN